jgi:hypothetical protein
MRINRKFLQLYSAVLMLRGTEVVSTLYSNLHPRHDDIADEIQAESGIFYFSTWAPILWHRVWSLSVAKW